MNEIKYRGGSSYDVITDRIMARIELSNFSNRQKFELKKESVIEIKEIDSDHNALLSAISDVCIATERKIQYGIDYDAYVTYKGAYVAPERVIPYGGALEPAEF